MVSQINETNCEVDGVIRQTRLLVQFNGVTQTIYKWREISTNYGTYVPVDDGIAISHVPCRSFSNPYDAVTFEMLVPMAHGGIFHKNVTATSAFSHITHGASDFYGTFFDIDPITHVRLFLESNGTFSQWTRFHLHVE
jgi:hypothetical protein